VHVPSSRLLTSLAADVDRLHAVAARDLTAPVPTCPDWVVDDLVRHAGNALRNVALRRVLGQDPILRPDPPVADPLAALRQAHADLVAELVTRPLDELAGQPPPNAHTPAENAYFWLRRMTHEIAVHRVDAELALGEPVTAVPPDLAVDGITEVLEMFLRYASHVNPGKFADLLTDWGDTWLLLSAGDGRWRVTVTPTGVDTAVIGETDGAAATVRGEPAAVMLWLYGRGDGVTSTGAAELVDRTRAVLRRALS
jgi:uncharacterized protein (TIGR03083 family)